MNKDKKTVPLCVLQVVPELNSGGVERGTVEIAGALVANNHQAWVCSNGGNMVKRLNKPGVGHFKLPVHTKNPARMVANIFALRRLIKQNGIRIVHVRSRAPAWSAYFAAKLTGCAFVTTFHGVYGTGNPLKRFYNSIMLKGDKVIAVSNYIRKHIETRYHFKSDNVVVIHRGVDLDYFNPASVDKSRLKKLKLALGVELSGKIIILPARFTRWKGHIFLLDALRYLGKHDFTCLMVGDIATRHYEYRCEVEGLIAEYGLANKVYICPAVTDMPALYTIADIVVSASQEPEAFGRTVTEAQAMGKIVIATNIGAPLETIIDGKTGFLVEATNPDHLSETLSMAMETKGKTTMAELARKHIAKEFSLDAMCNKTLQVYQEVDAGVKI